MLAEVVSRFRVCRPCGVLNVVWKVFALKDLMMAFASECVIGSGQSCLSVATACLLVDDCLLSSNFAGASFDSFSIA